MVEEKTIPIMILVIVSIMAVLGVVVVMAVITIPIQEAEAGCERGPGFNKSIEKSNGRCFDRGTF